MLVFVLFCLATEKEPGSQQNLPLPNVVFRKLSILFSTYKPSLPRLLRLVNFFFAWKDYSATTTS